MAEHTPGPWLLDCKKRHARHLATGGYHTIDAGDLCNKPESGYVGFSLAGYMSDEDARLIAAAPDLLAALKNISRNAALDDAWLEPVHAAIAKAIGEAQ